MGVVDGRRRMGEFRAQVVRTSRRYARGPEFQRLLGSWLPRIPLDLVGDTASVYYQNSGMKYKLRYI
jgi:hypothetical protein